MSSSHPPRRFDLPKSLKSESVLTELSKRFAVRISPNRRVDLHYYDTFDWRLFRHGLILVGQGDEFGLCRLADGSPLQMCHMTGRPVFWSDFPEGPLRDRMRSLLAERALQPVGNAVVSVRDLRVLNKDEKTVVRARVEEGRAPGSSDGATAVRTISVEWVRGYDKEARSFSRALESVGLTPAARSQFEAVVEAQGRNPGDYSSKFTLVLDPTMTAQQAAGEIFKHLLATMESNVDGVRDDVDTEFLHDFRVAIRRTRTGLALMKGVLPKELADEYRSRFAEIGRGTNRLRDLDVFLRDRDAHRALIDESLRPGLDGLFNWWESERVREHAALVRILDGQFFHDLTDAWRHALESFGTLALDAPRATVPVEKMARQLISRRHRRVVAAGGAITDASPDEALHKLRIGCKKLRYLLEFYASLYAGDEITALVRQLKNLQDNLGEFNDLSMLGSELRSFVRNRPKNVPVETAAAVGALVAGLVHRQRSVRGDFKQTFAAFAAKKSSKRFARLFG